MNAEKWHHSEIRIAINDESQGSIAKNLRRDELLYNTFIIHSAGERIFKIGEHLAKLRAKSLTVSYIINNCVINNEQLSFVNEFKYLGHILNNRMMRIFIENGEIYSFGVTC